MSDKTFNIKNVCFQNWKKKNSLGSVPKSRAGLVTRNKVFFLGPLNWQAPQGWMQMAQSRENNT